MSAIQHVYRRGAVYWWRRRLRCVDGARKPIAVSLRTGQRFLARSIAATLTLITDRLLNTPYLDMLTQDQISRMLSDVVSRHLHKFDHVAAMEIADGEDAQEGRRLDLAMGCVHRLIAARGVKTELLPSDHAAILAAGLREDDIPLVADLL